MKHPDAVQWRCFYCDETFTLAQENAARWHFGDRLHTVPACKFSVEDFRRMEAELERYRGEDTDLHRQLHSKSAEHQAALRLAEETGYARGLTDANNPFLKD